MKEQKIKNIQQLRWIGFVEGVSYVVLLLVSMPLKYYFEFPMAVKVNGWIHGVLFIAYIFAVLKTAWFVKWNYGRIAISLIASLIPLATFVLDRSLKKEQVMLDQTA
jgi:integral membrane protein